MLGAIIGDIVGSRFEFHNHKGKEFELFAEGCFATDDSIMTLAVAKAILACKEDWEKLGEETIRCLRRLGRKHPDCGFGGRFHDWIFSDVPLPYGSFGNGAAMRVSPCGFIAKTEEEAKLLSRKVTEVTHNHEEGIRGAEAVATAVFMAGHGATKQEIRERMDEYYELDFTLDEIREEYEFNETCQQTVPQALTAFLESVSFEDSIRNAISLGGDSDTLAAITGSIAEAYYGVPDFLRRKALKFLDDELIGIFRLWEKTVNSGGVKRKFDLVTKYIGKLENEETRKEFYYEFSSFVRLISAYNLRDYQKILEKYGLEWTEESMKAANANNLDEEAILALLLGAIRAERFANGALESFVNEGCIDRWLCRLKAIDDVRKPAPEKSDLVQLKMNLRPFGGEVTNELFLTGRKMMFQVKEPGGGTAVHSYEFDRKSELGELALLAMEDCLSAEGWHDAAFLHEIDYAKNLYELEVKFEGGKTAVHRGAFDRAHIPEKQFLTFSGMLIDILRSFGLGEIISVSAFQSVMKQGEVKYCGVEFTEGGQLYHYRTTDLRIQEGDRVIVPVGENDAEREVTVRTVEFCRWDDTPYPLEKTKEIVCSVAGEGAGIRTKYLLTGVACGLEGDEEE